MNLSCSVTYQSLYSITYPSYQFSDQHPAHDFTPLHFICPHLCFQQVCFPQLQAVWSGWQHSRADCLAPPLQNYTPTANKCTDAMNSTFNVYLRAVAYPGIFFGGGFNKLSWGQNRDLGCSRPLVRGSGGICNLVQEIPFHIVKLS